jgi:hypothetical protein
MNWGWAIVWTIVLYVVACELDVSTLVPSWLIWSGFILAVVTVWS